MARGKVRRVGRPQGKTRKRQKPKKSSQGGAAEDARKLESQFVQFRDDAESKKGRVSRVCEMEDLGFAIVACKKRQVWRRVAAAPRSTRRRCVHVAES